MFDKSPAIKDEIIDANMLRKSVVPDRLKHITNPIWLVWKLTYIYFTVTAIMTLRYLWLMGPEEIQIVPQD